MSRVDDRVMFTAIVFVLSSGCAWRHLPPSFGITVSTATGDPPGGPAPEGLRLPCPMDHVCRGPV
jgi:transposase